MKKLFNINDYVIDTSKFNHMLHDMESELEEKFAEYVGAKYAVMANSASSLIQMCLLGIIQNFPVSVLEKHPMFLPSIIPIAVANIVHNSGIPASWSDDVDWVGGSYVLYDAEKALSCIDKDASSFKIVDSAQEVRRNQFKETCSDDDMMIFSFYPTKPVGGMDGGMIATNNKEKAAFFKQAVHLGVGVEQDGDSWKRVLSFPGWKLHANSSQCYVALKNLEKLDEKNERLDQIKEKYNDAFSVENKSRHLYRLNVSERDLFFQEMEEFEIQVGQHYEAAHLSNQYRMSNPQSLEKSEFDSIHTVSIPFNEALTEEDVDYVISKIKQTGRVLTK